MTFQLSTFCSWIKSFVFLSRNTVFEVKKSDLSKLTCLLYLKIGQMEREHLEQVMGGMLEGYLVKGKICCCQLRTVYPLSSVTVFCLPL